MTCTRAARTPLLDKYHTDLDGRNGKKKMAKTTQLFAAASLKSRSNRPAQQPHSLCPRLLYLHEMLVVVQLEAALEKPELQIAGGGQQAARPPLYQRRERLRAGRPNGTEQAVRVGNEGRGRRGS